MSGQSVQGSLQGVNGGEEKIKLNDIGDGDKRFKAWVIDKIVKGDGIAIIPQLSADRHNFRGRRYVFEHLDDNLCFGERSGQVLQEKITGEIDKTRAKTAYLLNTFSEKGTGEDARCCLVAAGIAELRGFRAAIQQLVGKEFLMGVQNRLSGYEKIHGTSFCSQL